MAKYLIGLDHGTGGAKACLMDEEGKVLAYAYREYPIYVERPGWSEHDPQLYWTAACEVIRECLKKSGVTAEGVFGIANSSALPSLVMVDRQHRPLARAYNLMDRRATEEVQWLRENIGNERIFAVSCNRLEDHPVLVNLMWEKRHRPEVYRQIHKALTIDGYIRLRLTGRATANYSSGAFFGVAYDVRKNRFDDRLLDMIGLERDILPDFFPCGEVIGYTGGAGAEEAGLRPGIPVAAGSVDCNAGWLGGGAIEAGDIQVNLGTCGVLGVIHKSPDLILDTMINCTYVTDSSDTFVTIACTTCGGQSLRYLRDSFSQLELAAESLVPGFSAYDCLEKEAEAVSAGSEGLLVLPYLMGERTPLWDSYARAVAFGLSLNHGKPHLVRAMMEGVAYSLYDSYRIIEQHGPQVHLPIVMNEGGAKNRLWRQIITDVFNVPTVFLRSRTGAPAGDAFLAGVATGVFPDFSIARHQAELTDRLEPNSENHALYMDYYKLFGRLYCHLRDDFAVLARIRDRN